MALVRITPVEAQVRWDRHAERPAAVRWQGRELNVTGLSVVRDERAAYPAGSGPRVTFLLDTNGGQASVTFDARRRRWYVEALDTAA